MEKLFLADIVLNLGNGLPTDAILIGKSDDIYKYRKNKDLPNYDDCNDEDYYYPKGGYIIGPERISNILTFSYNQTPKQLKISELPHIDISYIASGLITGTVMIELFDGEISIDNTLYWLHPRRRTLPKNISYEKIIFENYLDKLGELRFKTIELAGEIGRKRFLSVPR